ncbi:MAG: T9SS type A sorting domain-containing protein, partial [Saprospiraceae bacterium]|nr:T9SS type A sorting domain-containing protein [Saprospiraceae bacterium]
IIVSVEPEAETPGTHLLSNAYPNPFNPQSQFTLAVAQDQFVTAELYNTLGQRVATLFSGTVEANQVQSVAIDGAGLASGTYVVRITGERFTDALRVTVLK